VYQEREAAAGKASRVHEAAAAAAAEAGDKEAALKDAERDQAAAVSERKAVDAEKNAKLKERAAAELDEADLTERQQADSDALAEGTAELAALEGQVRQLVVPVPHRWGARLGVWQPRQTPSPLARGKRA
jgi:hypothetical protein